MVVYPKRRTEGDSLMGKRNELHAPTWPRSYPVIYSLWGNTNLDGILKKACNSNGCLCHIVLVLVCVVVSNTYASYVSNSDELR